VSLYCCYKDWNRIN